MTDNEKAIENLAKALLKEESMNSLLVYNFLKRIKSNKSKKLIKWYSKNILLKQINTKLANI